MKRKKGDLSRREIIASAIDTFYEYGYEKASMRHIASKVGLTQAALYYHFRNKEEILYTIVDHLSNEILSELKSILKEKEDPIEKLRNIIMRQILFIKSQRKELKILIEDKRFLNAELHQLVKGKEKSIYMLYKSYIEELQKEGKLRKFDVNTATFGIFGMINWLYHWYNPEKRLKIEEVAKQITDILFNGLLNHGSKTNALTE